MRYIETFREGMHVSDVYLCKISRSSLQKMEKNMATWSFRTRQEPLMPRSGT